jgi:hypothetical protein
MNEGKKGSRSNHNQQRQQSTIKGEAALADVNDCYLAAL